jgi:hypothetical protein
MQGITKAAQEEVIVKWHCHSCNDKLMFRYNKNVREIFEAMDFVNKHKTHFVFETILCLKQYPTIRVDLSLLGE